MALTAVVLAGGPPDAVSQLEPGTPNKAFVHIGGVSLVERTLRALRSTQLVERLIVVAPRAAHGRSDLALADEIRDDGPRIADSLSRGLANLDPDRAVLVSASDLPVLTATAIEAFAGALARRDADITYSCVERSVHEASFPRFPHTWAKLKEGEFCGGGVAAMKPRALAALDGLLDRLGQARKNPVALASVFGFDTLANYLLGRLTIDAAERRASDLLGAPAAAAVCAFAEIAINVDRPGDVERAEALVTRGEPA
jgi:molybdopterin-guanine dinucleotide biosynthesis protein A